MLNWFVSNGATIVISILLLLVVIWVLFYLHKKRTSGLCSGCSGSCKNKNCNHMQD